MGNSESRPNKEAVPEVNNNDVIVNQPNNNDWKNAVNGNTEELSVRPNINHAAFETTSEEMPFTESENVVPVSVNSSRNYSTALENAITQPRVVPASNSNITGLNVTMKGGFFDQLASLLQDTETNVFDTNSIVIDSKLNQIRSLLQESEVNNFSGGDVSSNRIRDLLLQDTESFMNFRGGEHSEQKDKKHVKKIDEVSEEEKEEKEEKEEEEKEEKPEVNEVVEEMQKESEAESDQSGGENLDTELKVILKELQANNKSNYKGGKSSRKSSKKSNKSKKQSRRETTEESAMTNGTYDIDTDSGDEDYLSSTSEMNTSDININHYRS